MVKWSTSQSLNAHTTQRLTCSILAMGTSERLSEPMNHLSDPWTVSKGSPPKHREKHPANRKQFLMRFNIVKGFLFLTLALTLQPII